jgi:hypothetical protein
MFVWETHAYSYHLNWYKSQARLFAPDGEAVGPQFRVHEWSTVDSYEPAIAGLGDNGFVVVWTTEPVATEEESESRIFARRFSTTGSPLGGESRVNSHLRGLHRNAAVAGNARGRYVVAWRDYFEAPYGNGVGTVEMQRFRPDGNMLGVQTRLYCEGDDASPYPVVARSSDRYMVAWSFSPHAPTTALGRIFDPTGAPAGPLFQVAEASGMPSIAATSAGDFLAVWAEYSWFDDVTSIWARRITSHDEQGELVRVDLPAAASREWSWYPSVAVDASGDFVVAWSSELRETDPPSQPSPWILARRFNSDGSPQGDPFVVNTLSDPCYDPVAASDGIGNFVVAWSSRGTYGDDLDSSIQARRYSCGLFCDGFERGNRSAWSK